MASGWEALTDRYCSSSGVYCTGFGGLTLGVDDAPWVILAGLLGISRLAVHESSFSATTSIRLCLGLPVRSSDEVEFSRYLELSATALVVGRGNVSGHLWLSAVTLSLGHGDGFAECINPWSLEVVDPFSVTSDR